MRLVMRLSPVTGLTVCIQHTTTKSAPLLAFLRSLRHTHLLGIPTHSLISRFFIVLRVGSIIIDHYLEFPSPLSV